MPEFFASWLLLVSVFAIALASPGPDLVMAIRNSIMYSRRAGVFTAIGFAAGVAVHVSYCLGGLAIIIAKSVVIFSILKFVGAAYLFYVGFKAIKSNGMSADMNDIANSRSLNDWQAFRSGFITNLFNPKATLFFLALFTQILKPDIDLATQIAYGLTCILMTAIWFSIVATVLTTPSIRIRFFRISKWLDRVCGGVFIALGIKLAATKL